MFLLLVFSLCFFWVLFFSWYFFFFNDTATTEIYTLSLHDALPISTVRLEGTPKLVCSRPTRSSTSGSTAATRSRWLSACRPRVGYQSCATPPRASGLNPLGTTSAALGKRAWNLNAIGIIDCAVAPQPWRNTNRCFAGCSGVGAKRKTRPEDIGRIVTSPWPFCKLIQIPSQVPHANQQISNGFLGVGQTLLGVRAARQGSDAARHGGRPVAGPGLDQRADQPVEQRVLQRHPGQAARRFLPAARQVHAARVRRHRSGRVPAVPAPDAADRMAQLAQRALPRRLAARARLLPAAAPRSWHRQPGPAHRGRPEAVR